MKTGSVFFTLRFVVGAEEAAELKVKLLFPSPVKEKTWCLFQCCNIFLPRGPLYEVTPLTCGTGTIVWLLEHKKLFGRNLSLHMLPGTAAWECANTCFLLNRSQVIYFQDCSKLSWITVFYRLNCCCCQQGGKELALEQFSCSPEECSEKGVMSCCSIKAVSLGSVPT